LAHKGKKTNEVLETEMFSILNQLLKRSGLTSSEIAELQSELKYDCIEYLQDYDVRIFH